MPTNAQPGRALRPPLREFGQRLDAIAQRERASLGAADRAYILRLIRLQRISALSGRLLILASLVLLPKWGHALASWALFWPVLVAGTLALTLGKVLENMEIGHNVMHGQWDWMNDPVVNSRSWEWDMACPAEQWRHSHNVLHHSWTNVVEMDRDIGYGMLRVTEQQRWHPIYLLQPLNVLMMAVAFQWFIALHDFDFPKILSGDKDRRVARRQFRQLGSKSSRQFLKDYVLWPLLAGPLFFVVLGANVAANVLRNIWLFAVIFCGHFPAGVAHFDKSTVAGESRAEWYRRQLLGSCNIRAGRLFHLLSGNLSHQIEHHLFPDLPSNRYQAIAPEVEALCAKFGLPYNSRRFSRQLGSTAWTLARLMFPGGRAGQPLAQAS